MIADVAQELLMCIQIGGKYEHGKKKDIKRNL